MHVICNESMYGYRNILENGFSELQVLEGSNYFNVTSCACIADIDLDGENEILVGSYGKVKRLFHKSVYNYQ